jgi:hypothetical protein
MDPSQMPGGNSTSSERQPTSTPAPRIQMPMGEPLEAYQPPANRLEPVAVETPSVPVWAQRLLLVIEVVVAVWAGMLLTVLPWTPYWASNPLLYRLPLLKVILLNNFVRGVLSGIGLIDIWIGVWDAVSYRDAPSKQPRK